MNENSLEKWDLRFLNLAKEVSSWSRDPSTKVGCVIVGKNRQILSTGFNGFAMGVDDSEERYNNRELKYKLIVHAECNAVLFADGDLSGSTVYTYPFMPCVNCASIIIQSGVKRVVSFNLTGEVAQRWEESFKLTRSIFKETGIDLKLYELEEK